jgi:hypothetical protein
LVSPIPQVLQVTGSIARPDGTSAVVVPSGATAVVLNVTVAGPTADGFLSVRPDGTPGAPETSNLNFTAGDIVPNAVTAALPSSGKIELTYDAYSAAGPTTDVLVDVTGYYVAATGGSGNDGDGYGRWHSSATFALSRSGCGAGQVRVVGTVSGNNSYFGSAPTSRCVTPSMYGRERAEFSIAPVSGAPVGSLYTVDRPAALNAADKSTVTLGADPLRSVQGRLGCSIPPGSVNVQCIYSGIDGSNHVRLLTTAERDAFIARGLAGTVTVHVFNS